MTEWNPILELSAENRLEEIGRVQKEFRRFAGMHGLGAGITRRFLVVLDELLSNVIFHGYSDDRKHTIDLSFSVSDGGVRLRMRDDGRPFDIQEVDPPPLTARRLDERELGGLGIHLVRELMDEITYSRAGGRNVIVIRKRFRDEERGKDRERTE